MELRKFQIELEALAEKVHQAWERESFKEDIFPDLAFDALSSLQDLKAPELGEVLEGLKDIHLPGQIFPGAEFSDFPLTLVHKGRFVLDIYFWYRSDTNIHDHHFSGAFKVIEGASFQVSYKFQNEKALGRCLFEGEMTQSDSRYMPKGSLQKIEPREKFIHHVFHLEQPTITLCLRTVPFANEALSSYIFPKYRISLIPTSMNKIKWLKAAGIGLNEVNVNSIPLEEAEALKMLYHFKRNEMVLTPFAHEFLSNFLKEKKFAQDFFVLENNQTALYDKLKRFGTVLHHAASKAK